MEEEQSQNPEQLPRNVGAALGFTAMAGFDIRYFIFNSSAAHGSLLAHVAEALIALGGGAAIGGYSGIRLHRFWNNPNN